jgi:carbonic anhydrase
VSSLEHLLQNYRDWAEKILRRNPEFFFRPARQQSPRYLWIGCSDSRVHDLRYLVANQDELGTGYLEAPAALLPAA